MGFLLLNFQKNCKILLESVPGESSHEKYDKNKPAHLTKMDLLLDVFLKTIADFQSTYI